MIENKLLKNPELSVTLACVLGGVKQASFRRGMTFSSFPFNMYFFIFSSDAAPLSAPAFSFCFPLLNATLRESSDSTEEAENTMMRALQVINEHSQLRADTNSDDVAIDEVQTNGFIPFSVWWLLSAQSEV